MPFDSIGFSGYWDAAANKILGKAGPGLRNDRGQAVQLFRVAVAGTTVLGGIAVWQVDDWAYFDGYSWGQFLGPNSRGGGGGGGGSGRGISNATVDNNGHLILFYTDQTSQDVGSVLGGTGAPGTPGAAGRSITGTVINGAGHLIVSYSDNTSSDVGTVVGPQGSQGIPGVKGDTGLKGDQGLKGDSGAVSLFREYRLSDYGAVADDSNANCRPAFASIVNAIAASATKTGTIVVPPGEWTYTGAPIDLSNLAIQVRGSGRGVSRIVKRDNGGVFYANHNVESLLYQTHVQGMSIWTTVLNTGTAVEILYAASGGASDSMNASVIDEIDCRAYFPPAANQGWAGAAGIRLTNGIGSSVSRCSVRGPNNTYNQLQRGISLEGQCTDMVCRDNRVYFANVAFYQDGPSENVMYRNNVSLLTNIGLFMAADANDPGGSGTAGGVVEGNHFNARNFGIRVVKRQHIRVLNNLLYRWTENNLTWVGVQTEQCNDIYISGNMNAGFQPSYGGTTVGVVVANCLGAILTNNRSRECQVLLDWNGTSTGWESGNITPDGVRSQSYDAGVDAAPAFVRSGGSQGLTAPALLSLEAKDLGTVTVPGAKRGDMVIAKITSAGVQYNSYRLEGYVTDDSATVTFRIQNLTASSLGSVTGLNIRYKVERYTAFPANP